MHLEAATAAKLTIGLALAAATCSSHGRPPVSVAVRADSGVVRNTTDATSVTFATHVHVPGASRLQVVFERLELGADGAAASLFRATSPAGSTWQTSVGLSGLPVPATTWLPGDTLRLEVISDAGAPASRVVVSRVRAEPATDPGWFAGPLSGGGSPDPGLRGGDGGGGPSQGGGNNEYEVPVPGGGGGPRPPNEYGPNSPYRRPPNEHEEIGCAPGSAPWSIELPQQPQPTRVIEVRTPGELADLSGPGVHARIIGDLDAGLVMDHTNTNWIIDLTEGSLENIRFAPGAKLVRIVGANGAEPDLAKIEFFPTIGVLQEDLTFSNLKIFNDDSSALLRLRGRRVLVENCDLSAREYAIWGHGPLHDAVIRNCFMHDVAHWEACVRFYFFDRVKFENCTIQKIHVIPGRNTLKHTVRAYISDHLWFDRCTFIGGRILSGGPSGGTSPPNATFPVRGICFTDCTMHHWNISTPVELDSTTNAYLARCNINSTSSTRAITRSPETVIGMVVEDCTFNGDPLTSVHIRP